jgi:hypothetical protein
MEDAGLTQVQAAKKLGKPQAFVSKCGGGERRVNVVELMQVLRSVWCEAGQVCPKTSNVSSQPNT